MANRIVQLPIEVVRLPDDQAVKVSQDVVEVIALPESDDRPVRISQTVVETQQLPDDQAMFISQCVIEIMVKVGHRTRRFRQQYLV